MRLPGLLLAALTAALLLAPVLTRAGVSADAAAVIERTNAERTARGLTPLAVSPSLTAAAQDYAETMADRDHFAHVGPDGSLPWDRAQAAGYPSRVVGENLAWSTSLGPEAVVALWLASPGHRANLLGADWRALGVGSATARDGRTYWVQLFGTVSEEEEEPCSR